jgi:pantoate--beta-alanine ligase
MLVIEKVAEMQEISTDLRKNGKVIAVVPTMGYFHEGHVSLMKKAKEFGDVVITTHFVNPTQFAPNEDFEKYPRDFNRDSKIAEQSGTDYLFYPEVKEMYPDGYSSLIAMGGVTKKFEGITRPNHFNGVATVVAKLFNATLPDFAVFGQKDYQQTLVIKQLVRDLNFPVKIIISPTLRQSDGLAMSSRNVYLSTKERTEASVLFNSLEKAREAILGGERKRKVINAIMHNSLRSVAAIKIDYASSARADDLDEPEEFVPGELIVLLMAVHLGKTRLIDNALVTLPSNISDKPENFRNSIIAI